MEIKFKTALTPFKVGGSKPCYRAIAQNNGTVTVDDIANAVQASYGIKAATVKYHIGLFEQEVIDALKNGKTVQVKNLFNAKTVVKGSFLSANDAWDPEKNKLVAKFSASGYLGSIYNNATARNVEESAKVYIRRVLDNVLKEPDKICLAENATLLLSGQGLDINPENDDEKAWIEDMDGVVVSILTVTAHTDTTLDAIIPNREDLEDLIGSNVRICVSSRGGLSTEYAPAIARRTITIEAVPETEGE